MNIPTLLLTLAGAPVASLHAALGSPDSPNSPAGKPDPSWKPNGQSLLPLVSGKSEAISGRTLHWRTDGRDGGAPVLYNLAKDSAETRNPADSQPQKVRELQGKMDAWEVNLKQLL